LLERRTLSTAVGDEGGFAPSLRSHEEALDLLVEAIEHAGLAPGRACSLALDAAASELADGDGYVFRKSGGPRRSADELIALYARWSRTARARPRTPSSPTSRWRWVPARSRPERRAAPSGPSSTTGCSPSPTSSARRRGGWTRSGGPEPGRRSSRRRVVAVEPPPGRRVPEPAA